MRGRRNEARIERTGCPGIDALSADTAEQRVRVSAVAGVLELVRGLHLALAIDVQTNQQRKQRRADAAQCERGRQHLDQAGLGGRRRRRSLGGGRRGCLGRRGGWRSSGRRRSRNLLFGLLLGRRLVSLLLCQGSRLVGLLLRQRRGVLGLLARKLGRFVGLLLRRGFLGLFLRQCRRFFCLLAGSGLIGLLLCCCRSLGLLLRLGSSLVLQFDRFLQRLVGLLQFGRTLLLLLERALAGGCFVFGGLLRRCAARRRIGLGDLQLVAASRRGGPVLDLGTDAALARGGGRRCGSDRGAAGRSLGEPAAIAREVGTLRRHFVARAASRDGLHRSRRRDRQRAAGDQPVHVVSDERVGVGLEQRNQHLVQVCAGRLVLGSNLAQRIAGLDLVRLLAGSRGGGGSRRGGRRGCWRRSSGRRGRSGRRCRCRQGRCRRRRTSGHGRHDLGRLTQRRRVEQYRVLTLNPSRRRGQFDQQIEKRLLDRPRRQDADDITAVGSLAHLEPQGRQRRIELQIRLPERGL